MSKLTEKNFQEFQTRTCAERGLRLMTVRHVFAGGGAGAQTKFAEQLGIEMRRWNNYECGQPVPLHVYDRIRCFKFQSDSPLNVDLSPNWLSMDWLLYGDTSLISQRDLVKLQDIQRAAMQAQSSGRRAPKRKRSSRI